MLIDEKEIIVNFQCVEMGIIPLLVSGETQHVKKTLENMSPVDRRQATRKFRKILRKALKHTARQSSKRYPTRRQEEKYKRDLRFLYDRAGLDDRSGSLEKLSYSQINFRRHIVSQYLLEQC